MRPRMIVVAGPSGSGKSLFFPVKQLAQYHFSVDDRAAELNGGQYAAISAAIRAVAQQECERFVMDMIDQRKDFAVETTLRSTAALEQALLARHAGFVTQMVYIATSDVNENVTRVASRGLLGGHSAPEAEIRTIYQTSLANFARALWVFDIIDVFDGTVFGKFPKRVATKRWGSFGYEQLPLPSWVPLPWGAV